MAIITRVDLLQNRRTKIVATLGPASASLEMCRKLIEAGVNVFRLNMSHGTHEAHAARYREIRAAAQMLKVPVAVMADLCGPKIRTGEFEGGGVVLADGAEVTITTRPVTGTSALIASQYKALPHDVKPGDRVLLADGLLELKVTAVSGTEVSCVVIHGGELSDHKGINLPGVDIS
ncbi:MAG TPA: pyruvate kinase, partial [Pseudomonadales bacterium]|nr:pyruvate kinase [Pseudomonadales bacterium]